MCPKCGSKKATEHGTSEWMMAWQPYVDEYGVRHEHNPNRRRTGYECRDCGQKYELRWYHRCSGCGWESKPPEVVMFD